VEGVVSRPNRLSKDARGYENVVPQYHDSRKAALIEKRSQNGKNSILIKSKKEPPAKQAIAEAQLQNPLELSLL
jgi:hypothetical protein